MHTGKTVYGDEFAAIQIKETTLKSNYCCAFYIRRTKRISRINQKNVDIGYAKNSSNILQRSVVDR